MTVLTSNFKKIFHLLIKPRFLTGFISEEYSVNFDVLKPLDYD